MINNIDVSYTSRNAGVILPPVRLYANNASNVNVRGLPMIDAGVTVSRVEMSVKHANGQIQNHYLKWDHASRSWSGTIFAEEFSAAGRVVGGIVIKAYGLDVYSEMHDWVLGVADIEIYDANAAASMPFEVSDMSQYAQKNDDTYIKSEVIDDVQHYKKQVIRYDADMEAWGAEWVGDYILVNNEFVEV